MFLSEKCVPDPTKEVRSVSYRKVSERRGSWPLAYKNVTVQEDNWLRLIKASYNEFIWMLNQLLKLILSNLVEHLIKSLVSPSILRVQYVLHQVTSIWNYKIGHTCFNIRVPLFCKRFFGLNCTHSSDKLYEIDWETFLSMYLKFQKLKWVSFTLKNLMWTCAFVNRQLVLTCN